MHHEPILASCVCCRVEGGESCPLDPPSPALKYAAFPSHILALSLLPTATPPQCVSAALTLLYKVMFYESLFCEIL